MSTELAPTLPEHDRRVGPIGHADADQVGGSVPRAVERVARVDGEVVVVVALVAGGDDVQRVRVGREDVRERLVDLRLARRRRAAGRCRRSRHDRDRACSPAYANASITQRDRPPPQLSIARSGRIVAPAGRSRRCRLVVVSLGGDRCRRRASRGRRPGRRRARCSRRRATKSCAARLDVAPEVRVVDVDLLVGHGDGHAGAVRGGGLPRLRARRCRRRWAARAPTGPGSTCRSGRPDGASAACRRTSGTA